jgi:hypothetical protein
MNSMSGGSVKRFSIENRGACPRRGWDPPEAWCLWTCTLVIDPFPRKWWVGGKKEDLFYKAIERVSERAAATEEETTRHVPPSLKTFCDYASPQNGEIPRPIHLNCLKN